LAQEVSDFRRLLSVCLHFVYTSNMAAYFRLTLMMSLHPINWTQPTVRLDNQRWRKTLGTI